MAGRPLPIGGEWREVPGAFEVHSPFDGRLVAEVGMPGGGDVGDPPRAAESAARALMDLEAWERSRWLLGTSERIAGQTEELAADDRARGGQAYPGGAGRGR